MDPARQTFSGEPGQIVDVVESLVSIVPDSSCKGRLSTLDMCFDWLYCMVVCI
jgi:hypothetical protein